MSTFASQLKAEIERLVKKGVRSETKTFKKVTAHYRSEIAALKRRTATLEAQLKKTMKANVRVKNEVSKESTDTRLRFRAAGFASLRKKLELSAADMAKLIGVSGQTVYHWESGKSRPRASQLEAIASVRKMGKRKALAQLAQGE